VLVDARIRKLLAGVRNARTKLANVKFELNLKITELELRAQPLTPLEFREQCKAAVKDVTSAEEAAVKECTSPFELSLEIVTSLQEDPNIQ